MEVSFSTLKCDYCDYRDETVTFAEYPANIGRPCPKCGHSLLTQEEYDDCLKIMRRVQYLSNFLSIFKWINPFHYWRLIFGDNRPEVTATIKYPNRKTN